MINTPEISIRITIPTSDLYKYIKYSYKSIDSLDHILTPYALKQFGFKQKIKYHITYIEINHDYEMKSIYISEPMQSLLTDLNISFIIRHQ